MLSQIPTSLMTCVLQKTCEDKVRSDAGSSTVEDIKHELCAATAVMVLQQRKKSCIGEIGKPASHAFSGTLNNCTINISYY